MIARRVGWLGIVLAVAVGLVLAALDRALDGLVLTATAAVAIINGLWLEEALARVLQPGGARFSRGAAALFFARLGLWGALFAAIWVFRREIHLWAVAAGLGCFLVSLTVTGLREAGEGGE